MAMKRESKVKFGKPSMSIINGVVEEVVEVKIKDWGYSAIHSIYQNEELEADFIIIPRIEKMNVEKGVININYADNTPLLKDLIKEGFGDTMFMEDEKVVLLIKFLDKKIGDLAADDFIEEFGDAYTIYQPVLTARKNADDTEPDKVYWINGNACAIFNDNEEDDYVFADEEVWFKTLEEAEDFVNKNNKKDPTADLRYIGNMINNYRKSIFKQDMKIEIWKSLRYPDEDIEEEEEEIVIDTTKVDEKLSDTVVSSDDEIEKDFKENGGKVMVKFIDENKAEINIFHNIITTTGGLKYLAPVRKDSLGQQFYEVRNRFDEEKEKSILPRFADSIVDCIKLLKLGIADDFYKAGSLYKLVRYVDRGIGISVRFYTLKKYEGMKFMYTVSIYDKKEQCFYDITTGENQVVERDLNVRDLMCFETEKEAEELIEKYRNNAKFVYDFMLKQNMNLENDHVDSYLNKLKTEFKKAEESFSEPTMMLAKEMIRKNNPTFADTGMIIGLDSNKYSKYSDVCWSTRYEFQVVPVTFIDK